MSTSVMVPLDGSPLAEQALPLAISLARRLECPLFLLQVISPEEQARATEGEPLSHVARDYLGTIKHHVEKVGVPVVTTVGEGSVGATIVATAHDLAISHMVMSTHGRTGLTRWTLGSVTSTVLQLSNQPLFLLRPYPDQCSDLFPLPDLQRIVVALDGSPVAESSLPHVRKLARLYDAELLLFRAVAATPAEIAQLPLLERRSAAHPLIEADEYLEGIAHILQGEGFVVRHEAAIGPPAEAIQGYAQAAEADLIVMGTHMRERVGRSVLGSITDQVVRLGHRAVLVTRHSMESP